MTTHDDRASSTSRPYFLSWLTAAESLILLLTTYFFWFISAFPADFDRSGIAPSEWAWLPVFILPLFLLFLLTDTAWWVEQRVVMRVGILLVSVASFFWLYLNLPLFDEVSFSIDRADWFWLLALLIPLIVLRFLLYRRFWTPTPLDVWMVVLLGLGLVAAYVTPEVTGYPSRGPGMLMRPLLGIAWVLHMVEWARIRGNIEGPLRLFVLLGLLAGYVALTATNFAHNKADFFVGLTTRLDTLPDLEMFGIINPNEIAGAMTWLLPITLGASVFYRWRQDAWLWRSLAVLAFGMLLVALFVGQSRSSILGVSLSMLLFGYLVIKDLRLRLIFWGLVVLLMLFQAGLVFNVVPFGGSGTQDTTEAELSERDQNTLNTRLAYWESALAITNDYPLTGAGMNMYRNQPYVREDYPIDAPSRLRYPPHAHNELLQITTDFGVPGLLVMVMIYGTAAYMAWRTWRHAGPRARVIAAAAFCALLAHLVYGQTDAIPIWDRMAFVFWMVLGLLAAQYRLEYRLNPETTDRTGATQA